MRRGYRLYQYGADPEADLNYLLLDQPHILILNPNSVFESLELEENASGIQLKDCFDALKSSGLEENASGTQLKDCFDALKT